MKPNWYMISTLAMMTATRDISDPIAQARSFLRYLRSSHNLLDPDREVIERIIARL